MDNHVSYSNGNFGEYHPSYWTTDKLEQLANQREYKQPEMKGVLWIVDEPLKQIGLSKKIGEKNIAEASF